MIKYFLSVRQEKFVRDGVSDSFVGPWLLEDWLGYNMYELWDTSQVWPLESNWGSNQETAIQSQNESLDTEINSTVH